VIPEPPDYESPVAITLERAEALVLFELMWRFADTERLEILDQAEKRALWNLCAYLESVLAEPFDPRYDDLVEAARAALRDPTGEA
jgi:hypothetical protein